MHVVSAATGSGRMKPPLRRSANTLRMFSNPAGFVCNLKIKQNGNESKPRAGTACATHSPQTTQAAQQPDIEQVIAPAMEPAQPAAQSAAQPALAPQPQPQPGRPDELLYDPDETAQMLRHLTDGYFDPEYVLLFGKLAGGTPHSDAVAYDLLMVVRETPEYDWIRAKRILRYRMPYRYRKVTYINPYILPLNYVESHRTPFLYFAHAEGELLHCSDHYRFRRPKHLIDFAKAYADAKFHFDTFRTLGNDLLEQAQNAFAGGRNVRLAAQFSAQAIVYFYHTLYYVYHGMEFDIHDPVVMHDRMRTLSTKLMLVFDDNHIENIFTLPWLKQILMKTPYSAEFYMAPQELEMHMGRVQKAAEIIENYCGLRLELYKELGTQ